MTAFSGNESNGLNGGTNKLGALSNKSGRPNRTDGVHVLAGGNGRPCSQVVRMSEFVLGQLSLRSSEMGTESDLDQRGIDYILRFLAISQAEFLACCSMLDDRDASLPYIELLGHGLRCAQLRIRHMLYLGKDPCVRVWKKGNCRRQCQQLDKESFVQPLFEAWMRPLQAEKEKEIRRRFRASQRIATKMVEKLQEGMATLGAMSNKTGNRSPASSVGGLRTDD